MQEQEPSVTDILSSIRQILSSEIGETSSKQGTVVEPPQFDLDATPEVEQTDSFEDVPSFSESPKVVAENEDIFMLTPQMRLETKAEEEIPVEMTAFESASASVSDNTVVTPMTPDKIEQTLQPAIQEWLNKHLPQMVERIVSEEVRRIFNKR